MKSMANQEFFQLFEAGEISLESLGHGMHLSYRNAKELLRDAKYLKKRSPARALSLAVLALEETGKIFLLAELAPEVANGPIGYKQFEAKLKLRSHQKKALVAGVYGESILNSTSKLKRGKSVFKQKFYPSMEQLVDKFKQLGFYVNFFRGDFILPNKFARDNDDWVQWIINLVAERIKSVAGMHKTEAHSIAVAKACSRLRDVKAIVAKIGLPKFIQMLAALK